MKKKYFMFGILACYILFSLYMILVSINKKENIHIKDIKNYTKTISSYSEQIDKLKNKECKNSLNKMVKYINKTHFDKDVDLKEYYEAYYGSEDDIIKLYIDAFNSCNIKDDKYDYLYVKALSASSFPNTVRTRYLLSYRVLLRDKYNEKNITKNSDEIGTYTTKSMELELLASLIESVKK